MAVVSSLGVTRLLFYGPEKQMEKKLPEEKRFGVLEKTEEPSEAGLVAFPDYKPQNTAVV